MNKFLITTLIIVVSALGFALLTSSADQTKYVTVIQNNDKLPQVIHGANLDKDYNFAGEALNMQDFDIRERLDRELMSNAYRHSSTLLAIKRAHRYFPEIERIFAEMGIPDDLKYVAVAESDLSNATSPAGAKGVWQFMKGTARDYGMYVGEEVDERYHVEKATRAAATYLQKLYNKYGSWTSAAACYNMGQTRFGKEYTRQRATSYFDMNLSEETMRYIFRIVAIKDVLSNPENYGFYIKDNEKYAPLDTYATVTIKPTESIHPWMRSYKLTNAEKRTYEVRVP